MSRTEQSESRARTALARAGSLKGPCAREPTAEHVTCAREREPSASKREPSESEREREPSKSQARAERSRESQLQSMRHVRESESRVRARARARAEREPSERRARAEREPSGQNFAREPSESQARAERSEFCKEASHDIVKTRLQPSALSRLLNQHGLGSARSDTQGGELITELPILLRQATKFID